MKKSPENSSSFLSRKTFWWFNSMCALGRRKPLEIEDLYSLNQEETCATLVPQWERLWDKSIRGFFYFLFPEFNFIDYYKLKSEAQQKKNEYADSLNGDEAIDIADSLPLVNGGTEHQVF